VKNLLATPGAKSVPQDMNRHRGSRAEPVYRSAPLRFRPPARAASPCELASTSVRRSVSVAVATRDSRYRFRVIGVVSPHARQVPAWDDSQVPAPATPSHLLCAAQASVSRSCAGTNGARPERQRVARPSRRLLPTPSASAPMDPSGHHSNPAGRLRVLLSSPPGTAVRRPAAVARLDRCSRRRRASAGG